MVNQSHLKQYKINDFNPDNKVIKLWWYNDRITFVPVIRTGEEESNFFQCRKFRGEGNASTYDHAVDFGYSSHDQIDFYEYGGLWNFWKNQTEDDSGKVLAGKISYPEGWIDNVVFHKWRTVTSLTLTLAVPTDTTI